MLGSLNTLFPLRAIVGSDVVKSTSVMPNPFTDRIIIKLQGNNLTEATVSIQNTLGVQVYEQKLTSYNGEVAIDFGGNATIASGTYVVTVSIGNVIEKHVVVKL